MTHQTLERRELLAAELGPQLISVAANSGENFRLTQGNVLTESPTQLTFRFDGSQQIDPATLAAITIDRSGGDGVFGPDANGNTNDIRITPGFLGFGESQRIVIARFSAALPDDQYRVRISGFDDTNNGVVGLRNTDGDLFEALNPTSTSAPFQTINFQVEIGPQVVAVVPQPIVVNSSGVREQMRSQVFVYFNDDKLSNPAGGVISTTNTSADAPVVQTQFYQLYFTNDTVENTDGGLRELPTRVTYDPTLNRAVLEFSSDLALLPGALAAGSSGTYRLRIGSSQALPVAPSQVAESAVDAGSTFASSRNLATTFNANPQSIVVSGQIEPTVNNPIQWPGFNSPGVRDNRRDAQITGQPDTINGINRYFYNFASVYGVDTTSGVLDNAITEPQKQRAREILSLYAQHLGVQFIETEDRGLQIVTGDLRALVRTATTGPGGPTSEYRVSDLDPTRGVLILDSGENWFDGYGLSPDARPSWFVEALRGVGSLLGLGSTFEQVPGVASGSNPLLYEASQFPVNGVVPTSFSIEPDFLSTSDIIPGQSLHRPETRDADLYRFDVASAGKISVETFAQRLDDTSSLNTDLKLWKLNKATGQFDLVARNDDFYSLDSFVGVDVTPNADGTTAEYVIGITASGNDDYNPNIAGSGSGGRSQGVYQMRITFQNSNVSTIRDTDNSALDGDGDGIQGGDFNFWFRTAKTKATAVGLEARTLFVDKSSLNASDSVASGDLLTPYRTIAFAFTQARPGDVIRILPSRGADGLLGTQADNQAYEIGRGGSTNAILSDGERFNVPRGVTVMIDAGTIIKLGGAKISVGSERIDEDRSLAALQVLGVPVLAEGTSRVSGEVLFTSYSEERRDGVLVGIDTNSLQTQPSPGDWAGIEFRNDVDYSEGRPVWETEGIFLNYASHANIQYGGGSISATEPSVTPLQLSESRPTLIFNTIRNSRDAAISADPNSFLETNFHAPIFQRATSFTSDYDRVGPDLRGNVLTQNSNNGLFIRVDTPAGGERQRLTVSARFDDADVVHSLSEVLVIQGQTGGLVLLEDRPEVGNVTISTTAGGTVPAGTVDYRITHINRDGSESLASLPTLSVVVAANQSVSLGNLPATPAEFSGRRLYRRIPGTSDYVLVTQLDRQTSSYVDNGRTRGGLLPAAAIAAVTGERLFPRYDARLSVDPGLVLKLDSARIEASFGSDFYAEGTDGKPIVFTSRLDDTYGAGGTFDTNNDGNAGVPTPGRWSGLVFRQGSTASLDNTVVRFAGGFSGVAGGVAPFNAVEILQADVRVANSLFSDNAGGSDGTFATRDNVGFNVPATIFVRGAQPTIVNNTIINNAGAAISINPDALNHHEVNDAGRSTGVVDLFVGDNDNQGPLVAANKLDNNGINGLLVRNESLTTESVWDDTDIVHVVQGQVYAWNHHHRSGLRLKSDPNQSLVVKFQDGGSLIATGYRNDTEDSIGGTIQVLGQPGFPVILTSVNDDTVGAGFTPAGLPQINTDNLNVTPTVNWAGIVIQSGANDRNVAFIVENEQAIGTASGANAIPSIAQVLGSLARTETSSDDSRRSGFNVRGALSQNSDLDVYRFFANGNTEVYIDIDDTSFGLDTVVELVDFNGNVLAQSNSSSRESNSPSLLVNQLSPTFTPVAGAVLPLLKSGAKSVENPNELDAGMRVILQGSSASVNEYFVRVRSNNNPGANGAPTLPSSTAPGLSKGQYQLSVRLRETDEIAGSTVRLANIRFASTAIDLPAAPSNSPLAGEHAEELNGAGRDINDTDTSFAGGEATASFSNASADPLGSLNSSNRGVLRVSGVLGNQQSGFAPAFTGVDPVLAEADLDVYRVDILDNSQNPNIIGENRFVSTTFDLDYADQLGRANTSIAVYRVDPSNSDRASLILHSRDSSVADDQGRPLLGVDQENLSGGSAGSLDAYIGPVELQVGTYYVVVSSAQMIPRPLDQLFEANASDSNVRILPVSSQRNIAEFGFDENAVTVNGTVPFSSEFAALNQSGELPQTQPFFDNTSIVPYTLEDVRLFLTLRGGLSGTNQSTLISIDPFTGQLERNIGQFAQPVGDLAIRRDGELFAFSLGPATGAQDNGNTGNFLNISSANAAATNSGDDGLTFRQSNAARNGTEAADAAQLLINAIAFTPATTGASIGDVVAPNANNRVFIVGNRDNTGRAGELPAAAINNIVYSMVETNGDATNQGSTNAMLDRDFPANTPLIDSVGPASNKQELGIVDVGQFEDSNPSFVNGIITGLAQDPVQGANLMYAVTNTGGVYSFSIFSTRDVNLGVDTFQAITYARVINSTFFGVVPRDAAHAGTGAPQFSSLTLGPQTTEGGRYRNILFATTTDGWLYTLQIDANGAIQPAQVLVNGQSAVQITTAFGVPAITGGRSVNGAAFSIREENIWHTTTDRNTPFGGANPNSTDNLHGVFLPHDQSRIRTSGGTSLYFGLEPTGNAADNRIADTPNGVPTPGGVHGSTVSRPFSLESYGSGDKPTLYFNYFIETETGQDYSLGNDPQMDSFRVFAAGDDGQWRLVSTNDTFRSFVNVDEYDYFATNGGIPVQEAFDNTGRWRQARVDLSPLAGNKNVQIRYDFSTAGGMQNQLVTTGYLTEIQAVPGRELVNGSTFTLSNSNVFSNRTFEFVRGASINMPSGAQMLDGQSVSFVRPTGTILTLRLTTTPIFANDVAFTRVDTAATIAAAIAARLQVAAPELNATAVGAQLIAPDANSFSLSPARFGHAAVTIPANLSSLVGQPIGFANAAGVTTTLTLQNTQSLSFGNGTELVTVTADVSGTANDVHIVFVDTVLDLFSPNVPATAVFDPFRRDITVTYNSNPLFAANNEFADVVSAIDAIPGFGATLSAGTATTAFTTPAVRPIFSDLEIYIDPATSTPTSIALAIANRLNAIDATLLASTTADLLVVRGATSIVLGAAFTAIANPVSFNQGSTASQLLPTGNTPIFYNRTMTNVQVRDAIRLGLANGLGEIDAVSGVSQATIANFPGQATNRIRVFEHSLSLNNSAVGFSTFLPGDEFGGFGSSSIASSTINARPGLLNDVEGVYIDDIVVGFAERGEVVYNASPVTNDRNFVVLPETRTFTFNDQQQPEYPNEILVGGYTLEIRQSSDYGVPEDYDPIRLGLNEQLGFGRSFDTNDRLSHSVTLVAPTSLTLVDGDLFTLSNGSQRLTFEFDSNGSVAQGRIRVPFTPLRSGTTFDRTVDDSDILAASIRDAINSPQARNVLGISAAGRDGREVGPMTGNRIDLFGSDIVINATTNERDRKSSADIQVNPSSGRFIKLDLVAAETPYGRETGRTIPVPNQDTRTVASELVLSSFRRATATTYVNGQTDTLVATGKIGDPVSTGPANELISNSPGIDVDIVKIFLRAGDRIDLDLDTTGFAVGNPFAAPQLQVFDEAGTTTLSPLVITAAATAGLGEFAPGVQIVGFVAPADGYYYVVVNSRNQVSFGEYQLTIRPTVAGFRDVLMVDYHSGKGDTNVARQQGQFIIESNFISNFASTGIRATFSGPVTIPDDDQFFTSTPLDRRPGLAAQLRNDNTARLLPGSVISNNVIVSDGATGIVFSGESIAANNSPAPVPFGRIVNNTVVGAGAGTGIAVSAAASPTVLNNIISGFGTGLNVSANSNTTVEGANAYQGNGTNANIPLASTSFDVGSGPLFEDAANDLYIPANGSIVIDSSFASVSDRDTFLQTVKRPVGLAPSPIIAPTFDAYGIPRFNDPLVTTPSGVGANVSIDRGAIDRADFTRPVAVLVAPQDFIAGQGVQVALGDIDPDSSFVRLPAGSANVPFFEVQLLDPASSGPDAATITDQSVLLTEDGVRLIPGVDYTFGYSDNSRIIRLTPTAGLWRPDSVYEITLNNQNRVRLELPAGDEISDGDRYTFTDSTGTIGNQSVFEFDSGFVLQVPQTLGLQVNNANNGFTDGSTFTITAPNGNSRTFEINLAGAVGSNSVAINLATAGTVEQVRDAIFAVLSSPSIVAALDLAPRAIGLDSLQIGSRAGHVITGNVPGLTFLTSVADGVDAGETFSYRVGANQVRFEFVDGANSPTNPTAVPISISRTNTVDEIATAISNALLSQPLGLVNARSVGNGTVLVGGTTSDGLSLASTNLVLLGTPGVTGSLTLTVPGTVTTVDLEGQTFSIQNGNQTVSFIYTSDPTLVTTARRVILPIGATPTQIAALTANEINNGFAGALSPTSAANVIRLGEQAAIIPPGTVQALAIVNVGTTPLVLAGVSGGAIAVPFIPSDLFSPAAAAAALNTAIATSPLASIASSPGGGTLLFSNTRSILLSDTNGVISAAGTDLPAIADLAGNPISSTRDDGETRFTIIMPEVRFDFGDAPNSYSTLLANDGPRHTVNSGAPLRLGQVIDTEQDGQVSDDALAPIKATLPAPAPIFTINSLTVGSLDIVVNAGVTPTSGTRIQVSVGNASATFELVSPGIAPLIGNIPVALVDGDTPMSIAERLAEAIRAEFSSTGEALTVTVDPLSASTIALRTVDDEDGVSIGTFNDGAISYKVFLVPGATSPTTNAADVLGFLNPLDPSGSNISLTATGAGLLDAWIDFDGNGSFDVNEQVLKNTPVVDGTNTVRVTTPSNAKQGTTWARFRLSTSGNLNPTGVGVGGEVEDYEVQIISVPTPTAVNDSFTVDEDNVLNTETNLALPSLTANDIVPPETFLPVQFFIGQQPTNGTLVINDPSTGRFIYTPNPAFIGVDTFTYRLSSQANSGAGPTAGVTFATVSITVTNINDAPTFNSPASVNVLERDDSGGTVVPFATNVLPGPPTAFGENSRQTVSFRILGDQTTGDVLVMRQDPQIAPDGRLTVFPAADAVGSVTYVFEAVDAEPGNSAFVERRTRGTVTISVRPVNDAPRVNPSLAGTSLIQNPDEGWSVAADGTIAFTMKEDNTGPLGVTSPYVINLRRDPSIIGYQRIGLLDVYNVGPSNEADITAGGSQTLQLFGISASQQTALGGTITPGASDANGNLLTLLYVPPRDANLSNGGVDSFNYSVQDNNPGGGETFDLLTGTLIEDRRTSIGTVQFRLNPVNDKPQFDLSRSSVSVFEDAGAVSFDDVAVNIFAGPANAFDETNFSGGQRVDFALSAVSNIAGLFSAAPAIDRTGRLTFTPAPDAYGNAVFEIRATDNGADNDTRGDIVSSDPRSFTINIRPVNDRPALNSTQTLVVTLNEDALIDLGDGTSTNRGTLIPLRGTGGEVGLLDVFNVGPANEAANITPGGNQTISLATPIPQGTLSNGTLTQEFDSQGKLIGLRYTPSPNFNGLDSFVYGVVDNGVSADLDGNVASDPRTGFTTVSLQVIARNDAPIFGGATPVTVTEDATTTPTAGLTIIPNWATNIQAGPAGAFDELHPVTGQRVTFTVNPSPTNPVGLFSQPPSVSESGTLTFTTAPDANGVAVFTVVASDSGIANPPLDFNTSSPPRTFTITVSPVNDAPTFTQGANVTVNEDSGQYSSPTPYATSISPGPADEVAAGQTVRFTVIVPADKQNLFANPNAFDGSGNPLPSNGLPRISDTGFLRFTPADNASGSVEMIVFATDSEGAQSNPVSLIITIGELGDVPVAVNDTFAGNEDTSQRITAAQILANDIDPDLITNPNEVLRIIDLPSTSLNGAAIRVGADGTIEYDPTGAVALQALAPSQTRSDTFTYRVIDSANNRSNLATVTVNVAGINDAPILLPDNPTLVPEGSTVIRPLSNDTDVDGTIDPASIVITLQPAFGAVRVEADGTLVYTPFEGFRGQDVMRYNVADNLGLRSQEQTITIDINQSPVAVDDRNGTFLDESVNINVAQNDFDPDTTGSLNLNSIQIVRQPFRGSAVVAGNGIVRYLPEPGFIGTDSFQYTINDNGGRTSNVATVTVQTVGSRLQNPREATDVNASGETTPLDALLVINRIAKGRREGISGGIPVLDTDRGPNFYDVDGNKIITPNDALRVINFISNANRLRLAGAGSSSTPSGEGESIASLMSAPPTSTTTTSLSSSISLVDNAVGELADTNLAADFSTPNDRTVSALVSETEEDKKRSESEKLDAIDALWAEAATF